MLNLIHTLLDEADVVVTYNGKRFDIPTLNKEFIKYKLTPPAPYKQIDLFQTARSQFRFASNKLDYVAQFLGLGAKHQHKGHDLWKECMAGNKKSLSEMEKYNKHDVVLLEKLYFVLLPWIKNHPSRSVFDRDLVCPNCGNKNYQRRGTTVTGVGRYPRFHCQSCGTWFRGNKTESKREEKYLTL
jgi:predicted PolB exonuclease-like 3'-5' exonuclease